MKGIYGWKWTKDEYPFIILWIFLLIFIIIWQINIELLEGNLMLIIILAGASSIIVLNYYIFKEFFGDNKNVLGKNAASKELPEEDELSKKIKYKAKDYSWNITYISVVMISAFASIYNISHIATAGLIILSMIVSQFIFVLYFNIKGDVD